MHLFDVHNFMCIIFDMTCLFVSFPLVQNWPVKGGGWGSGGSSEQEIVITGYVLLILSNTLHVTDKMFVSA